MASTGSECSGIIRETHVGVSRTSTNHTANTSTIAYNHIVNCVNHKDINSVIEDVSATVVAIATAVEEQSTTTREIAQNVGQASQGIQVVNESIAQGSAVAGGIANDIAVVNQEAGQMASSSGKVNHSAAQLFKMAETLQGLIGGFKVEDNACG